MSDDGIDPYTEAKLANLTPEQWSALEARVREPEPQTPQQVAAAAVQKALGVNQRGRASKARAAQAMREYRASH